MKKFYEKDTDIDLIKGKKIAIFGYGSQGQAHALNLKDSGVKDLVVALRDGSKSKPKAKSKGLKVMNLSDAAEWAEIIMILIPDELQPEMYSKHIEQYVKVGTSLAFANGSNIHNKLIEARGDLDVFMVEPKAPGQLVRSEYVKGSGVPCLFAVHQDGSGEARDLAMSYASAIGGGKSGIIETTFKGVVNPKFEKTIYERILEHYKTSMRSKDRMTKSALSAIIMRIRGHEKETSKGTPKEVVFGDVAIIKQILIVANDYVKMIISIVSYGNNDKINQQATDFKKALNLILSYLPDDQIKKFKSIYKDKNIKSILEEVTPTDEDIGPSKGSVGTGFFVDGEGHFITNYHVIKYSNNKAKIMFKHEETDTKVISYDELLDIALLKAKVKNKHYIKFSNTSPKKAQSILVAGFPYGNYISDDLKITAGIINSLKGIQNNTSMLQIDATINPGNSGGPIVDKVSGSLVGVATMKLSKDFTKEAFGVESENTNYGIKSSQVRDFLEANNIDISIKSNKLKISELEEATVFVFSKKD